VSYNSSKSAVLQMARSMACELGTENIRVNSLSPGHIYTSFVLSHFAAEAVSEADASFSGVVVMMIRALWVQDDSCLSRHPTTSLG
jgi:NAD(P)-dependent dehydrogenase (short-subunit alcohol dehydrogenase family)